MWVWIWVWSSTPEAEIRKALIAQSKYACQSALRNGKPSRIAGSAIEEISCSHNYVDFSNNNPILRKGAISAKLDERVIIPINMKEGVLLGRGLGNEEWNNSAPHGSGRVLSRGAINSLHTVSEFRKEMKGIYTSCISKDTLDEAPFAYRGIDYIKEVIKDTVEVENVLTPIFNYKGGDRK